MANPKGLGELKCYLPRNYGRQVASRFGCSVSKVYKVVAGQRTDFRILQYLFDLVEENIQLEKKVQRAINQQKQRSND